MADPVSLLVLTGVGVGLEGLSAVSKFQDIGLQENAAEQQKQQELQQNQLKADINSVNLLHKANISYDKQLSANALMGGQGNANFSNLVNANYTTQKNDEFVNQANLNVMNLNTLFKQNQQMEQLQSMRTETALNLASNVAMAGSSIAGSTFTGKGTGFTGIQNSSDYSSLFNIGN